MLAQVCTALVSLLLLLPLSSEVHCPLFIGGLPISAGYVRVCLIRKHHGLWSTINSAQLLDHLDQCNHCSTFEHSIEVIKYVVELS